MSGANNNNLYQIEKLTNNNFSSWKYKIQMILKSRKLWKYVDGTIVDLSLVKDAESYQEAHSQIVLTISDNLVGHVRSAKTASQAWQQLCSVFEQKGLSSQIFLYRKLLNVKFDESGTMQSHISKIRELSDQLDSIGNPVKDKELAIILLCSLPERYNPLIISLEARNPNEITFDSVGARLLAEEERQKESDVTANANERAFYGERKFDSKKLPKHCNHCHRDGHVEEYCWNKHGRPPRRNIIEDQQKSSVAFTGEVESLSF